jgi:hypothetical protein
MNKRLFIFTLAFVILSFNAVAQYTQVGEGAFTSSIYGITTTDTASPRYARYAYIYNAQSIAGLEHNDTITALAFKHQSFDSLRGLCNLRIFIKSTDSSDFGQGSLNWLAETRNGMTLVYDANPKDAIGNTPGFAVFEFTEVSGFEFDTTGGATNLEVLIEYTQQATQTAAIPWYVESAFSMPTFNNSNETKYRRGNSSLGLDSITNGTSILKPTLRIYHPRYEKELRASRIYSLGTYPLLMNKPDSIKVVVENVGKKAVTNQKVYLEVSGANTYEDSVVISSIQPYTEQFVYFSRYQPTNNGTEALNVKIDTDGDTTNNRITKNRLVNYNVYSHADPFRPNDGGIGFNGATGDFVAKFYVDGTSFINQIKVDFNLAGRDFQLGVWDVDSATGLPGNLLFISDSLITVSGTYILPVLPRIRVEDAYYVGIRQTGTTNVAFSFQWERPIRPNSFYFAAPAGDSSWTPFSPGFDFNFNIQPRLQVANDLAVLDMLSPQPNDSILYDENDSLEIEAAFINYGFLDQRFFNVNYEIRNRFNQQVYSSTQTISLDAGDTALVSFDKFSRFNIGSFTATASVQLNIDSVSDNNTQTIEFFLIKENDVAVDQIFEPGNNDSFELGEEGFWPTARAINYGVNSQVNVPVTLELLDNEGNVVSTQTNFVDLEPEESEIVTFDSIFLHRDGRHELRVFTDLAADSFRINDTSKVTIFAKKTYDLKIQRIIRPTENQLFALDDAFRPFVNFRNDGLKDDDSTYFYAMIVNQMGDTVYTDTVIRATNFFSSGQVLFKEYDSNEVGDFTFYTRTFIEEDQVRENDTMSSRFKVVTSKDLQLLEIVIPESAIVASNDTLYPEVRIRNNGLSEAVNAPVSMVITDLNANVIWSDTLAVNLTSFTTGLFTSEKPLVFSKLDDYFVDVHNNWSEEYEYTADDTLSIKVVVRFEKDLGIVAHQRPFDGDTLELEELVVPRFQAINIGLDTLDNVAVEITFKDQQGATQLIDTVQLGFLGPQMVYNFIGNESWNAQEGLFTYTTKVLSSDDNEENNGLETSFEVVVRKDLAVNAILFPTMDTSLLTGRMHQPVVRLSNQGIEAVEDAIVRLEVSVEGNTIYQNEQTVSLNSGQDTSLTFDSTLRYTEAASAKATLRIAHPDDQRIGNDTSSVRFTFTEPVSAAGLEIAGLTIMPNPANEWLYLTAEQQLEKAEIIDMRGVVVQTVPLNTSSASIHLAKLAAGAYQLKVYTSGSMNTFKFIKE